MLQLVCQLSQLKTQLIMMISLLPQRCRIITSQHLLVQTSQSLLLPWGRLLLQRRILTQIKNFITSGKVHQKKTQAHYIRQCTHFYDVLNGELYQWSYNHMWIWCLGKNKAQQIITKVHFLLCRAHQSKPKMKAEIKRLGYYYPSMITNCMETTHKCL